MSFEVSDLAPFAQLASSLVEIVAKAIANRGAAHAQIVADTEAAIATWRGALTDLDASTAAARAKTDAALRAAEHPDRSTDVAAPPSLAGIGGPGETEEP